MVLPTAAKELHYFDRFSTGGCTAEELARYQEYFPRSGESRTGEWTPVYATAPWIPRLLAAAAPDARLLILLRDPVERYLSGMQLAITVAKRGGVSLSRYARLDAFARGLYHLQITGLLRYFDRSQLMVLQYERCTLEPGAELRRTFEFLEIDPEFTPGLDAHPERQPEKPMLDADTRQAYVQAYTDEVIRLIGAFPEIDTSLWPNFTHLSG